MKYVVEYTEQKDSLWVEAMVQVDDPYDPKYPITLLHCTCNTLTLAQYNADQAIRNHREKVIKERNVNGL